MSMNYKNTNAPKIIFNTHNTVETARITTRKDKEQIMHTMRVNIEDSKIISSSGTGKQLRLKKNIKRFRGNRYNGENINEVDEEKVKSQSRNRPKKQHTKINTSLVINRGNLKAALLNSSDHKVDIEDQVTSQPQEKEINQLIKSIEVKPKGSIINTFRQVSKKISNEPSTTKNFDKKGIIDKNSIPMMNTIDQSLIESQSEAIKIKTKNSEENKGK